MKQVFTSWGKKAQSKQLPTVTVIAEGLQQLDPAPISQSESIPREKNPMKDKSFMEKRRKYCKMQGAEGSITAAVLLQI